MGKLMSELEYLLQACHGAVVPTVGIGEDKLRMFLGIKINSTVATVRNLINRSASSTCMWYWVAFEVVCCCINRILGCYDVSVKNAMIVSNKSTQVKNKNRNTFPRIKGFTGNGLETRSAASIHVVEGWYLLDEYRCIHRGADTAFSAFTSHLLIFAIILIFRCFVGTFLLLLWSLFST